ncbi:MAG TPA: aldo/keto reductase [Polyangiaceae bacterium]|nr:aldo/keto reductase [Polyangiaceae bacterium]
MRKRPLGRTSLEVSELSLGTWGLSGDGYGPVPGGDQDGVIDRALALGITLFETADCYGEGRMETRLGRRVPPEVEGAVVVTKIGTRRDTPVPRKDFSVPYLKDAVARSQERLRRNVLDCVLLHNPSSQAFDSGELGAFMASLVQEGKVKCWGASVGNTQAGRSAINYGAQVLEIAFNIFHTAEHKELEQQIRSFEIGILARSVLAHGLLCGHWPPTKEFSRADHRSERWSVDELRRRITQLNAVRTLLSEDLPSLRGIALRFALSSDLVSSAVLGPRNWLQLDQLVREAGKEPPYLDPIKLVHLRDRLVTVGVQL